MTAMSFAQTGKLFNTDKGLSSSFVGDIYQDYDGFLWISTRNGLNRYDGYNFKVFKKGQPGCEGMSSNYINTVRQSRDKILYIGTQRGVQIYKDDKFQDVKLVSSEGETVISFVTSIIERKDGTIMVGTSGNGIFEMKGGKEAHEFAPTKDIYGIRRLFESNDQTLWILTENKGLIAINKKGRKSYFDDDTMKMTSLVICEDNNGNLFLGTYSHGLYIKAKNDSEFRHVEASGNINIQALYVCRNGDILLGLDGNGVAVMNPKNQKITWNPYFTHEINIDHAKVNAFVEDNAGNIWFSMLQKGVFMQPEKPIGFGYTGFKMGNNNKIGDCCVTGTLIDSRGRSWIGTDKDGIYVLDNRHNLLAHISDTPSTIITLAEDKAGRIWAGAYVHGLGYIDPNTFIYNKVELSIAPKLNIFDIEPDSRGELWIATMGHGLIRYNHETGATRTYMADDKATSDRKRNALVNNYINQLDLSTDHQRIYVATTMGLCCFDIARSSWITTFGQNVISYGKNIRSVAETSGKYLWYGTEDGLVKRDIASNKSETFTENEGLPDKGIASIIKDKDNNLWVATDHGLCLMNENNGDVKYCFYVDDGLQSNEFSDGAASLGADGTLLLGGIGGITWFNPRNIKMAKWKAKVQLTNLIVNGMPVSTGDKSGSYTITDKPVMESRLFKLSPDDNTFSIQLSTLTYDAPEHICYSYSINNEEWTTLQPGNNEINFSHLPPGMYNFRIKAEKNDLESEIKEFSIKIHSPWYASTFAYILYFALFIGAIYIYIQYRRRKEQDKLNLQAHIHAEEMNEAKIKFFMNISHEIRTPMTLIMAPLMTLLKDDSDPQRTGAYVTIKRNAERILHLINQMMDLRKIEKGMMKMRMRETDIIGFVNDICNMFDYQAKAKKIKFKFIHEDENLPVWIDLANFDKVLVNLLSNAFKYTPTGGRVNITVSHDDKNVTIEVKDTGEGIPKDKINKIFERFYQSETYTNNRHLGTGIGLDLTNSLVLLHHGNISAKNNEDGQGSTFTVVIPMGKSHLTPDEIAVEEEQKKEEQKKVVDILKEAYEFQKEEEEMLNNKESGLYTAKRTKPWLAIVEDDIEIQNYLAQELKKSFKVSTFDNGQEALTGILRDVPDIVLSDVMMPIMDGNTLCAKLKHNIRTNMIPVVLLTAKSSDEDKLEGLETGADAYIVKPFNLDILRRTLQNLVAARNMMRNKMEGMESQEKNVENLDIQTADNKLMEKVMKVVNANMNNADLSIDYIAKEVGLSRVHFYRKMKTLTNQSPHNFLRNIRMKQAARLFDDGHQNVNDVMYAVGYNNASSFSVAFKAVYGMSPREYIKMRN